MKNQTSHTLQNQTPSLTNKKGIIAMKPPKFPQELIDRFEQTKAMKFSKKTIKEVNELLTQSELKNQQNQLQDYTEVAGLKVLTQDLDKPQCPEVKLLKEGQCHRECCCWKLEDEYGEHYQYDIPGALKEAEFRGIKILSDEEWALLKEELGSDGLKELLNLRKDKDYKGYCNEVECVNRGIYAYYWSRTIDESNPVYYGQQKLYRFGTTIDNDCDIYTRGCSIRCRLKS